MCNAGFGWAARLSVFVATWGLCIPTLRGAQSEDLKELAARAVAEDPAAAKEAAAKLRADGPDGLAVMLASYGDSVRAGVAGKADDASWQRARLAIDAVAGQRDAYASGLYWYTDWDAARAAAKASGKPILSLRLLGTLDTEFSCANSRFFRTALYANREVSAALRDGFVLHWKSVRPVPRVTIDFGDGRKVERTITGNSIHYLLDADGRVIDAFPGLYGPQAFLRRLQEAAKVAQATRDLPAAQRAEYLRAWHAAAARQDDAEWARDVRRATGRPAVARLAKAEVRKAEAAPTAVEAAKAAAAKTMGERRIVAAVAPDRAVTSVSDADAALWQQVAALHLGEARLDDGSLSLMRTKVAAGGEPLPELARTFERAMAEDTVRNEYNFHRQIHAWLAARPGSAEAMFAGDVTALNERVYAELFLTPSSDPWLGLVPRDAYSALEGDGVCATR